MYTQGEHHPAEISQMTSGMSIRIMLRDSVPEQLFSARNPSRDEWLLRCEHKAFIGQPRHHRPGFREPSFRRKIRALRDKFLAHLYQTKDQQFFKTRCNKLGLGKDESPFQRG